MYECTSTRLHYTYRQTPNNKHGNTVHNLDTGITITYGMVTFDSVIDPIILNPQNYTKYRIEHIQDRTYKP